MNWLRIFPSGLDCSQAKVTNFDSQILIMEENVVTLEITVDDIFGMQIAVTKMNKM